MRGNRITTEIVFFHCESRTAIFTDLIQQFPRGWFKGWRGAYRPTGTMMTAAEPTVPRKFSSRLDWTGTPRGNLFGVFWLGPRRKSS